MKRRLLAALAGALLLAACLPADPRGAATPPAPGPNPTDFIATRVAVILTEGAAPSLAASPTPPAAATAAPTAVPTEAATATPAPTVTPAISPTPSPTPYPTLDLARFPRPPAALGGEPHFYFGRPIGEGGNVFVASNYRYGSTLGNQLETHHGVEFANSQGVPVVAVGNGVVYYAGTDLERQFGPQLDFYGNLVVLQLSEPWLGRPVFALYGHLETVTVQPGQAVAAGEQLGTVGATGVALGPHLHLEVRLDNPDSYWATRNPELWLAPGAGRGTLAVRVANAAGQYLPGMRVSILCSDGAARFLDTYWDPGVNPDDGYGENAAFTDVPAGFCELTTLYQGEPLSTHLEVRAGAINFAALTP
ncbi:MAG: M23 family metallopeptidase [Anaerolineales bacterium]|nr:M23 family metallopeptidase [Anaerolineales bacterium]